MSSKPGETSVKWQLCYDMTAKMWWMVSGGRARGLVGGGLSPSDRGPGCRHPSGGLQSEVTEAWEPGTPSLRVQESGFLHRPPGKLARGHQISAGPRVAVVASQRGVGTLLGLPKAPRPGM
jgi:hypothetical protein